MYIDIWKARQQGKNKQKHDKRENIKIYMLYGKQDNREQNT